MSAPLISICIPAYKKPEFVIRAIQSIQKQSYKQVEIIISDDSPNEDIKITIQSYISELNIKYYHNQPALKSPKNWNNSIFCTRMIGWNPLIVCQPISKPLMRILRPNLFFVKTRRFSQMAPN